MSKSRPKNCSHCDKPTTLHLTKIVNGELYKLGLCASCPQAKALKSATGFDLLDSPASKMPEPLSTDGLAKCPSCGLTPEDFKEIGRLGCARCYDVFAEKLTPMITKLHRGPSHQGKVPKGKRRVITPEEIESLKRRLEEYVSREEFELAAVVRDQLRALES